MLQESSQLCATSASACRQTTRHGFKNPIWRWCISFASCWRRNSRANEGCSGRVGFEAIRSSHAATRRPACQPSCCVHEEVELKVNKDKLAEIIRAFTGVE